MFIENLTRLGFTEKEAQVYLMLLRMGPAAASTLAQRVQMKRVSIYTILETLCGKGIVSYEQTELGRRYIPHDPECLYEQLEMEKAEVQMKWSLARDCVEALQRQNRYQQISGQRVFFCTGLKVIEKSLEEHLQGASQVHHLIPEDKESDLILEGLKPFFNEAKQRKLKWTAHASAIQRNKWQAVFPDFEWQEYPGFAQNGQLLIAKKKVFFLRARDQKLELMVILDENYADLLLRVVFEKKKSRT